MKIEIIDVDQEKLLKITKLLLRKDLNVWRNVMSVVRLEKITPKLNESNLDVSFDLILTIVDGDTSIRIKRRKIIELIFDIVESLPEE